MSRLLRANFSRLFCSVVFWVCMGFSCGLAILVVVVRYLDMKSNADVYAGLDSSYTSADGLLFLGGIYLMFAAAVFVGIFIGTEYSDGTVRNKVIAGHSRLGIYLSNLIVCAAGSLLMHLAYIVLVMAAGNLLLTPITLPAKEIILLSLCSSLSMVALTAVLLVISMLVQSRAFASVSVLVLVFFLLMVTMSVAQRLEAPEYYENYFSYNEVTGEEEMLEQPERVKNHRYLTGKKRKAYEFINDVLPSSQLYQVGMQRKDRMGNISVYAVLLLAVGSGLGAAAFCKRDLR